MKSPRVLGLVLLPCLALLIAGPGQAESPLLGDEILSDGFELGDTSLWTLVEGPYVAPDPFRFADLDLRDPHLFLDLPIFGCFDFTDMALPLALGPSFNGQIQDLLTLDGNGDGFVDASPLLLFRPLDTAGMDLPVEFTDGQCTVPLGATTCGPGAGLPQFLRYETAAAGLCLETLPGTTGGYSPAVAEPLAPCFATTARTVILDLGGIPVPLQAAQVAAAFVGAPPTSLTQGLLAGFLTEADADAILLPPDLPVVGGEPLSILLPGGTGNCAAGDDRDVFNGQSGWWFYLNFSAAEVPYMGF